jgi:quinol monooxygenase YgiN
VLCLSMFIGGVAWIAVMSSLNTAAQMVAPAWVRARALGIYLVVFQGGFAVGSILWGMLAELTSTSIALSLAALGLALGLAVAVRWHLAAGEQSNVTPVSNWPEPHLMIEPLPEDGPVLVISEYAPSPDQRVDFVQALYALQRVRRRNGAIRWGLFQDPMNPDRYVETFVIESWAEQLRLHEHLTVDDQAVYNRARAFGTPATSASTTHLIAIPPPKKRRKAQDATPKPTEAEESKAQATSPTLPG